MANYIVSAARFDSGRRPLKFKWTEVDSNMKSSGPAYEVDVDEVCRVILNPNNTVHVRSVQGSSAGQMCLVTREDGTLKIELTNNGSELRTIHDLPSF